MRHRGAGATYDRAAGEGPPDGWEETCKRRRTAPWLHVDGEDDDLDVRNILVLQHLELHLVLLLESDGQLVRPLGELLFERRDDLVRAVREGLHG